MLRRSTRQGGRRRRDGARTGGHGGWPVARKPTNPGASLRCPSPPRPPAHLTGSTSPAPPLHSIPRHSLGARVHPQGLPPKYELKQQLPRAALNPPLPLLPDSPAAEYSFLPQGIKEDLDIFQTFLASPIQFASSAPRRKVVPATTFPLLEAAGEDPCPFQIPLLPWAMGCPFAGKSTAGSCLSSLHTGEGMGIPLHASPRPH